MIDFGSRVDRIHNTYKASDYRERALLIDSSSFALGAAIVNAGIAFLLVATPAGWVALVVGGAVVVGAAAASIDMNYAVKNNSGG